jgi:hypothetical protein
VLTPAYPEAAQQIGLQLRELASLGIVYFDLHTGNIARQKAAPHHWRIFDFDCSWLTTEQELFPDWIEAFRSDLLPLAIGGEKRLPWKLQKRESAAVRRFCDSMKRDNDDCRLLRSGRVANGLGRGGAGNPWLQHAIWSRDIDALRYFYIFERGY